MCILTMQIGSKKAQAFDKGNLETIKAIVELAWSGVDVDMEHHLSKSGTMQLLCLLPALD